MTDKSSYVICDECKNKESYEKIYNSLSELGNVIDMKIFLKKSKEDLVAIYNDKIHEHDKLILFLIKKINEDFANLKTQIGNEHENNVYVHNFDVIKKAMQTMSDRDV